MDDQIGAELDHTPEGFVEVDLGPEDVVTPLVFKEVPHVVDMRVVALLEDLLERAKRGELFALVGVLQSVGDYTERVRIITTECDIPRVVGHLQLLAHRILRDMDSDSAV